MSSTADFTPGISTFSGSHQQLDNFLQYYRQKLSKTLNTTITIFAASFEGERIEWQQEAETMRILLERVHAHEAEMLAKKTEIAEVQKMLSDQRLAVHDERQQFMKLKREHNYVLSKLIYS